MTRQKKSLHSHHITDLRIQVFQAKKDLYSLGLSLDGGPSSEKLAPIYDEFLRWKEILEQEFQGYLAHKKISGTQRQI